MKKFLRNVSYVLCEKSKGLFLKHSQCPFLLGKTIERAATLSAEKVVLTSEPVLFTSDSVTSTSHVFFAFPRARILLSNFVFSFTSFTGGFSSRQNNGAVKVLRNENLHLQSVNYHGVILSGEGVKDFFMHYVCIRARARKATGSE